MKKVYCLAIFCCALAACYTPLNNSGVATTKRWLDIPAKKTDFEDKQYDSCYQFNLRFSPAHAADQLDLQQNCLTACCWRSEKEEVTLRLNENFENNLAYYGRAYKYTPDIITLKVSHSNLLNTTKVSVEPKGVISSDGLVTLSYTQHENPHRLAQIEAQGRQLQDRRAAVEAREAAQDQEQAAIALAAQQENAAKQLLLRQASNKIDRYFYRMNKSYKQQNKTFLVSERIFGSRSGATPQQTLFTCHARAKVGFAGQLENKSFSCGVWMVSLQEGLVAPASSLATSIWNAK